MFLFWARFKFQWLQLVLRCRLAGMLSSWLQRPILLDVPNAGSEALVRLSTALIHIAPPWNGTARKRDGSDVAVERHCHSQHYGTVTYYYVPSYVITILYHYSIIQIIHTLDHCSLEFYRTSGFHISWSRHLSCRRRGSRDMRLVSTTVGFFQWLGNELWKSCSEAVSKHVLTDCPSKTSAHPPRSFSSLHLCHNLLHSADSAPPWPGGYQSQSDDTVWNSWRRNSKSLTQWPHH